MQVAQRCERLTEWNSYRAKLIEQATNRRIIAVAFRGSTSIYGVQRGSETSALEPVAASVAVKTMVVNNRLFCAGLLMPPRLCAAIWAGGRWWWMPQARHRSRPAGSRARCNSPRLAAADRNRAMVFGLSRRQDAQIQGGAQRHGHGGCSLLRSPARPEQFIEQIAEPCLEHVQLGVRHGDVLGPIIRDLPVRQVGFGGRPTRWAGGQR
jgi:hypothetical protein